MITDTEKQALVQWARGKAFIKRLRIFGSRARGDQRPDSDLDIAVELDTESLRNMDESNGLLTWMEENKKWKAELEKALPYKCHLEQYESIETPTVHKGILESSIVVYEKTS